MIIKALNRVEGKLTGMHPGITGSVSGIRGVDTKKLREVLGNAVKEVETTSDTVRVTVKPTVIFGQVAA